MRDMLNLGLEIIVNFDGCQPIMIKSEDLSKIVWWKWVVSAVGKQSGRGSK